MSRLRSLSLRVTLGLSLALAGGLVVTGCSKPKQTEAQKKAEKKKARKTPPKPKPTNPWLDEVIKGAEVTVTYAGGEPIKCEWSDAKKRHLCPKQERWVYVGPEVWRVGKKDEYCVWQHPVADGVVTTKLKGLATQPLELRHAFAGRSYTVQEAAPVDVVVRVDGEERAKAQRLRKPGFDRLRVERAKEGKPGDVEIEVSASHTGVAHFCWQLERLPEGAPTAADAPAPEVKAASAAAPTAAAAKAEAKADESAAEGDESAASSKAGAMSAESTKARPKLKTEQRLRLPEGTKVRRAVPLKDLRRKSDTGKER